MENKRTLEEVRKLFEADRFATENGAVIEEIGDHYARCSLMLTDSHRNAMGAVMGGTYFMLADFAFAVASNNVHHTTVAQQVSINFLSGTRGSRLFARAACKKDGKTTCVYNIDVTDDLGRDIAQFVGTGYKL
mgnify:CR=1 FL=1